MTGLLTIKDQLFTGTANEPSVSPRAGGQVPSFQDRVGNFDSANELVDFLNRNDSNVVNLSLAFDNDVLDFDEDGEEDLLDPYVVLYYEPCAVPSGRPVTAADGCPGTQLSVSGEQPDGARLYFSGGLRLEGFFRVRSLREIHQGISTIVLEALDASDL